MPRGDRAPGRLARRRLARALAGAALLGTAGLGAWAVEPARPVPRPGPAARETPYEVISVHPHDPGAFVQGLVWHAGGFYESTGGYGRSTLRRVEFPSGRVVRRHELPPDVFGEGLALVKDRLVQLTWRAGRALVYDRGSFRLLGELRYDTEGWGLAYDGAHLVVSDGTDVLTYRDPDRFRVVRRLAVTWDGRPLPWLNELEYVRGEIWANVWHRDVIVRIDPVSGRVTSFLNLSGLLRPELRSDPEAVLNGIAYDASARRVFVTGKLWPRLFELRVR